MSASYGKLDLSGTAVDYQAKHERSYYQGDINMLFVEALDALDVDAVVLGRDAA